MGFNDFGGRAAPDQEDSLGEDFIRKSLGFRQVIVTAFEPDRVVHDEFSSLLKDQVNVIRSDLIGLNVENRGGHGAPTPDLGGRHGSNFCGKVTEEIFLNAHLAPRAFLGSTPFEEPLVSAMWSFME